MLSKNANLLICASERKLFGYKTFGIFMAETEGAKVVSRTDSPRQKRLASL